MEEIAGWLRDFGYQWMQMAGGVVSLYFLPTFVFAMIAAGIAGTGYLLWIAAGIIAQYLKFLWDWVMHLFRTRRVERRKKVSLLRRAWRGKEKRGAFMHPKRESHVKRIVERVLCDGLEEAAYRNEISDEEKQYWFQRFGNIFNMRNLIPRNQRTLKDRLELKFPKKPKIPGDKPGKNTAKPMSRRRLVVVTK